MVAGCPACAASEQEQRTVMAVARSLAWQIRRVLRGGK